MKHIMYKRDWGCWACLVCKKEKAKRRSNCWFQLPNEVLQRRQWQIFSDLHTKRRMCNDHRVQQGKHYMNIRNNLPRKALRSPSLKIKMDQTHAWGTCSNDSPDMKVALDKMTFKVPFSVGYSMLFLQKFGGVK